MSEAPREAAVPARGAWRAAALLSAVGPVIGLAAVWSLFALLGGDRFASWENQRLMLLQTAVVGTAAVGATIIIISGGIDLSVGSTIALGTVVIALLLNAGAPPALAALGGVATGVACGSAIGALVIGRGGRVAAAVAGAVAGWVLWPRVGGPVALAAGAAVAGGTLALSELFLRRLPLSPFIVTLAMWGALRGLAKGLGDNEPVYPRETGWLLQLMSNRAAESWLLPGGVWILLALALLMAGALRYTHFGRHVFAIGSSERTARLCGVPVERTKLLIYVVGVGCAGLAALLQFAYLSIGDPTTAQGVELRVIAAVVIGGASLSGGEGSIRGSLIGALIMTVVDNGCTQLRLDNWVQEILTGGIILVAVAVDRWRYVRRET